MFLLDKNKIKFDLLLERNVLLPGDMVSGQVIVTVLADVEVTALRLHIYGKERGWKRVRQGKHTHTVTEETLHFEKLFVLFGFAKSTGRKGGSMLSAGTHTYPFSTPLPTGIPPTFYCNLGDGGSELYYRIRAYADIPNGFDASVDQFLTVLSGVPVGQLQDARAAPLTLQAAEMTVHDCSCCGCFCCKHDGAFINVDAALIPRIVVTGSAGQLPPAPTAQDGSLALPQDPRSFVVRVSVRNNSQTDELKKVRLDLRQFQEVHVYRHRTSTLVNICHSECTPPDGAIRPGCSGTFYMVLQVPETMCLTQNDAGKKLPMPCVSTSIMQVSTILELSFPGTATEGNLARTNAVVLAAVPDHSNRVPPLPCTYISTNVFPEGHVGTF